MEFIIPVIGKVETKNARTKWKMFLPAFTVHAVIGKASHLKRKICRVFSKILCMAGKGLFYFPLSDYLISLID